MRYGTRAMAELAMVYPDRALSVRELAERQCLSPKYLEQIMRALKAAGLAVAVRGARGGYRVAKPPADITLSRIFEVLEGSPAPVDCLEHPDSCPMERLCVTRDTWLEMKEAIEGILKRTTLQDLADREERKSRSFALTYQI